MERHGKFAAASLQKQSYLVGEDNVRWAPLSVAHVDTPKTWTKVRYRIGHICPFGESMLQMSICKD
jgi:hypothetical protein